MADGERRSAKLSKQSEVDHDEDYPVSTVKTLVTKPTGDVCSLTVLSASNSQDNSLEDVAQTKPTRSKGKTLKRTTALEGTSPPPEQNFSQLRINGGPGGPETTTVTTTNTSNTSIPIANGAATPSTGASSNKEAKNFLLSSHEQGVSNDSGRGTFEIADCASDKSLSRTSSTETSSTSHTPSASDPYKDSTGVDLIPFFKQTLQKSPKDKKTLFNLEKELHNFIKEDVKSKKLPEMNPYDRMLVHRLAAHMGMDHNVDPSGKSVIVGKTEFTRTPVLSLLDYSKELDNDGEQSEKKILLKKPAHSMDEKQSQKQSLSDTKAKSFEERKVNYMKTREKIFGEESTCDESPIQNLLQNPPFANVMIQGNAFKPLLNNTRHSQHFKSADSVHQLPSMQQQTKHHRRANMNKSKSYEGTPHPHIPGNPPCSNMLSSQIGESFQDGQNYHSPPPLMATQIPGTPQGLNDPINTSVLPQTVQPHMNGDGSEYKFDPTNPPPFMEQFQSSASQAQPHPPTLLTSTEPPVSQMSQPMVAGMATGVADYPHAVSIVPSMIPQQVYPSPSQQPIQGQYLPASPGPGCQQSVRLIAINQGGPTPVEPQSQTTVPMPALPPFNPLVSSPPLPHYQPLTAGQSEEMSASYTQIPAVDGMVNGGATHFIQGYSLPHQTATFPSQTQYIIQQQQPASGQSYGPPQTAFYSLPQSSSTPPPLLTQPPPSHHTSAASAQPPNPSCVSQQAVAATPHQVPNSSQMFSVVQSPPAGATLTYPAMAGPHQVLATKAWPPGLLSNPSYRSSSPPAQQMTIGFVAPPPAQSPAGPAQFVALQPHQRPLAPTVIQLSGHSPGQQYLYRPITPLQGAALVRPRTSASQPNHNQQSQHRHNKNNKHKKGKKSVPSEEEGNNSGVTMVAPLIPGLSGTNTFIPPVSSNRQ